MLSATRVWRSATCGEQKMAKWPVSCEQISIHNLWDTETGGPMSTAYALIMTTQEKALCTRLVEARI